MPFGKKKILKCDRDVNNSRSMNAAIAYLHHDKDIKFTSAKCKRMYKRQEEDKLCKQEKTQNYCTLYSGRGKIKM